VLLLAFDTATPVVTVALHDGTGVIAAQAAEDGRRHGELLAAAIGQVLSGVGADPADLTAVAVGTGPGPYTGLRVGLVTARVLAAALGVPLHGVCTLDVIARSAVPAADGREFLVTTDARRKELYWARYSPAGQRLTGPDVSVPAALPAGYPVAGAGPDLYPGLTAAPLPPRDPAAGQLANIIAERIVGGAPVLPADPLYLRKPDARVPGKPKRVTA
jgi:tRNA threonylcarbamoyl adenosine modification protein YeaZ